MIRLRLLTVVTAAAVALLGVRAVSAESVGSPAGLLKKGRWVMSVASDFVFARQMNNGAEAHLYGAGHERGYGFTDWLSVYGMIGGAYLSVTDPTIVTTDLSSDHKYGGSLFASAQVKARLLERDTWEVTATARYIDARANGKGRNTARWHHWLMAGTVAKSVGRAKPYAGATWSVLSLHYKVRENGEVVAQDRYREDVPLGAVLGTDVYFGDSDQIVLNVEAAYQDGPELSTSIAYVF